MNFKYHKQQRPESRSSAQFIYFKFIESKGTGDSTDLLSSRPSTPTLAAARNRHWSPSVLTVESAVRISK
jgi:hypothetical protein